MNEGDVVGLCLISCICSDKKGKHVDLATSQTVVHILGKYMYFYSNGFWENIFYNITLTKFLYRLPIVVTYLYVTEFSENMC